MLVRRFDTRVPGRYAAARPRERATEAERGAGSAAAVPRSGAALDPGTVQLGNAELAQGDRLLRRKSRYLMEPAVIQVSGGFGCA
jgi:hypothetical protein